MRDVAGRRSKKYSGETGLIVIAELRSARQPGAAVPTQASASVQLRLLAGLKPDSPKVSDIVRIAVCP
jgi:hypothetical protein